VAPDPGGPARLPAACRRRVNGRPLAGGAAQAVRPGAGRPSGTRREIPAPSMVASPQPPEGMKRGTEEAAAYDTFAEAGKHNALKVVIRR
jgi:hypothetical protein